MNIKCLVLSVLAACGIVAFFIWGLFYYPVPFGIAGMVICVFTAIGIISNMIYQACSVVVVVAGKEKPE